MWDLKPAECAKAGLVGWSTEILFIISLSLTKVSVVLFFRRLIDCSHAIWMNRAIWLSIFFTVAYFLSFAFVLIFACNPVSAAWKSLNITWTGQYTCLDRELVDPLNGVLSIFSDLYSLIIPIVIVTRLGMPVTRKIVLIMIFCCSIVVLGAGIARTIWLSRMYTDSMRDLTCMSCNLCERRVSLDLTLTCEKGSPTTYLSGAVSKCSWPSYALPSRP